MNKPYIDTVRLLLEAAPSVFDGGAFAIKGGTAINLFSCDMPRLSVDIDAVFINHTLRREEALSAISETLQEIRGRLMARGLHVELRGGGDGGETKLFVRRREVVKIEVNPVFRGCILPPVRRRTGHGDAAGPSTLPVCSRKVPGRQESGVPCPP